MISVRWSQPAIKREVSWNRDESNLTTHRELCQFCERFDALESLQIASCNLQLFQSFIHQVGVRAANLLFTHTQRFSCVWNRSKRLEFAVAQLQYNIAQISDAIKQKVRERLRPSPVL